MDIHIVHKNDELNTELYVFTDREAAHVAAELLDGYVTVEPLLDQTFVEQLQRSVEGSA